MSLNLHKTALLLALNTAIFGSIIPVPAWAQTTAPSENPSSGPLQDQAQGQQTQAGKFIQDLGNHAITVIADKSLTKEQRTTKYNQLLNDAFDIKTIGHFVIGRAYDTATPEQQQEYLKLFEQLVIKIYSDRLNFYSGETFHVKGQRQESEKDIVVNSEITHPDGSKATSVDWRVRQNDGKFAVIDVVVEGVSQSVTQRQEYTSIIQRDGGKIDGLLDLMRQRVQGTAPLPSAN